MKLAVFNGSPRGHKSNTKILMDHFAEGFGEKGGIVEEVVYLHRTKDLAEQVEKFRNSDHVILAFPLYTDDMPGIVKNFIEALAPLCGQEGLPTLGIVIQSGFPEPKQSRSLERYMLKLVKRLGCVSTGSVVKGAVEGIQEMPDRMTRGLYRNFRLLGERYAESGRFDPELVGILAPRDDYSWFGILVFRTLKFLGLADFYWNRHLKKNKAFPHRFDGPYGRI
ncbi:MAG: flavodoxin family protein [Planctomycetota bacterium]|jgi:hypothetical protein